MFTFLYQSGHFRIERTNGPKSNLPSNTIHYTETFPYHSRCRSKIKSKYNKTLFIEFIMRHITFYSVGNSSDNFVIFQLRHTVLMYKIF